VNYQCPILGYPKKKKKMGYWIQAKVPRHGQPLSEDNDHNDHNTHIITHLMLRTRGGEETLQRRGEGTDPSTVLCDIFEWPMTRLCNQTEALESIGQGRQAERANDGVGQGSLGRVGMRLSFRDGAAKMARSSSPDAADKRQHACKWGWFSSGRCRGATKVPGDSH
jgi:hypothetical protein